MNLTSVIFFWSAVLLTSDGANILCIFLSPSKSHHLLMRKVLDQLLQRDHVICALTIETVVDKRQNSPNLIEINVNDETRKAYDVERLLNGKSDILSQLDHGLEAMLRVFSAQYRSDKIQQFIKDKHQNFDLIITDAIYFPSLVFSHIYKVPVVGISSAALLQNYYDSFGCPRHVFYPEFLQINFYDFSFWGKVYTLSDQVLLRRILDKYEEKMSEVVKEQKESTFTSLSEMFSNVHVMLVNVHSIWEGIRPNPTNIFHSSALQCENDGNIPEVRVGCIDEE